MCAWSLAASTQWDCYCCLALHFRTETTADPWPRRGGAALGEDWESYRPVAKLPLGWTGWAPDPCHGPLAERPWERTEKLAGDNRPVAKMPLVRTGRTPDPWQSSPRWRLWDRPTHGEAAVGLDRSYTRPVARPWVRTNRPTNWWRSSVS